MLSTHERLYLYPRIARASPPVRRLAAAGHALWRHRDRVSEDADFGDLDVHGRAVVQELRRRPREADTVGGSGCDDVPGIEGHAARERCDDGGDAEDQLT